MHSLHSFNRFSSLHVGLLHVKLSFKIHKSFNYYYYYLVAWYARKKFFFYIRFIYTNSLSKVDINSHRLSPQNKANGIKPFLMMKIESDKDKMLWTLNSLIESVCSILPKIMDSTPSIGIVVSPVYSPYQKKALKKIYNSWDIRFKNVRIYDIDRIQGLQKDIIIIILCDRPGIAFMSCLNRLNMAMTRARHAVLVAGFSSLFQNHVSLIFTILK